MIMSRRVWFFLSMASGKHTWGHIYSMKLNCNESEMNNDLFKQAGDRGISNAGRLTARICVFLESCFSLVY